MRDWSSAIRTAFREPPPDDVVEELAQHAAASFEELRADGCEVAEAERRVWLQIDEWVADPDVRRKRPRRAPAVEPPSAPSRWGWLPKDIAYAFRLVLRQPLHAVTVIVTMALGIAATTVLASVAYAVLLKPLPWADSDRLVRISETREKSSSRFRNIMTNASYLRWRDGDRKTIDALGAWVTQNVSLIGSGDPVMLRTTGVTPGLIELIGGAPVMGRTFAAGEEQPGREPLVILSFGLWQQVLGGRPDVIGQTLRLDGTPHTIIGVMPASFQFPDRATRAWLPFHVPPATRAGQPGSWLSMFGAIGRLRPGVTPSQAAAEGTARGRESPLGAPVAIAVFGSAGPVVINVVPILDAMTGDVQSAILLIGIAVALLLIAATGNIASLQLSRSTARRREFALRAALGAGASRLVRQSLVENLVLGVLAGVVGIALASALVAALPSLLPADFPRIDDIAFSFSLQVFAIVVSLVAAIGFGVLPAIHATRLDLVPALAEDALAPVGGTMRSPIARARAMIMAGQVAIACVLLIGATLLVRSFLHLTDTPLGYDPRNLLTTRVVLPDSEFTPERRLQTLDAIRARLSAVPGVSDVATSTMLPFTSGVTLSSIVLRRRDGATSQIQTGLSEVSASYFAAMSQHIVAGRGFGSGDVPTSRKVALVNREFAKRYLDDNAIGWSIPIDDDESAGFREIIGVVSDTVRQRVTDAPEPEMYVLSAQQPPTQSAIHLIVRSVVPAVDLIGHVRTAVREIAPSAPMESITTMENLVGNSLSRPRLYSVLLSTFATFTLVIAGVGLFGVLSYTVSQRAREIAVRTALGAQSRNIIALVAGQTLLIVGTGLAAGLGAAWLLSEALAAFVYGITTTDPVSFVMVTLVLLAMALAASLVPARRATRIDPIRVLRA